METDKAEQDKKIGLLKQDLKLLEGYRDHGVPAYLGLGLYRAQAYIPKLKALIPAEVPKACQKAGAGGSYPGQFGTL